MRFQKRHFVYIALALAVGLLGRRAWIVMPIIVFLGLIGMMSAMPRRKITPGWIALAAGVAIAVGVVLKFT